MNLLIQNTTDVFRNLVLSLQENTTLQKMNLMCNEIEEEGAEALAKSFGVGLKLGGRFKTMQGMNP